MQVMIMCNICGGWTEFEYNPTGILPIENQKCDCGAQGWNWQSTISKRSYSISSAKAKSSKARKK